MCFAEYVTRILALLQGDCMGKVKDQHWKPSICHLVCRCVATALSLPNGKKTIDTDSRSDLGQDTICALISCKLNTEDSCFHFQPSDELLKSAKSATQQQHVKAHPSHE